MTDIAQTSDRKVTVKRLGQIVMIGLNRPDHRNLVDTETFAALGAALRAYGTDPSLRAAVLFGHGDHFSIGIEQPALAGQSSALAELQRLIPGAADRQVPSKPVVVVAHGDTFGFGHGLFLAADVRVAAANVRFRQRHDGGGSTVSTALFVREAGRGNAMRYALTGDGWDARAARRMGLLQEICATPAEALAMGVAIATRMAATAALSDENA